MSDSTEVASGTHESHVQSEITSTEQRTGNPPQKDPLHIYECALRFIFPFHVSEESFTSALDALTNYRAATPLGIRRRCHRCVEETYTNAEHTVDESPLLFAKFGTWMKLLSAQRPDRSVEKIGVVYVCVCVCLTVE